MTLQEFDNQKWYKNMPVKESTGDPKLTYYVQGVNHKKRTVLISLGENSQWGTRWERAINIEPVHPEPTALDLIAQEREKQISKGYTVEHDRLFYPECQLAAIASDLCFPYEIEQAPEPPVPINWNPEYWKKLINLPYEDRLRIAGAMLAGELDRIINLENKES